MGYSISAPIKDAESRERMLVFLEWNLTESFTAFLNRHWTVGPIIKSMSPTAKFDKVDDIPGSLRIVDGSRLSYGAGRMRSGYDYGPIPEYERTFRWALVTWIALRIGKRKTFKHDPPLVDLARTLTFQPRDTSAALPFIFYDSEAIPLVPIDSVPSRPDWDVPTRADQHFVDRWGSPVGPRTFPWTVRDLLIRAAVRDFIAPLDAKWRQENADPDFQTTIRRMEENITCANYRNPVVPVRHSDLATMFKSDSKFKKECPFCGVGLFPVSRNGTTLKLWRKDHCVLCGQHVEWTDADKWGDEAEAP